MKKIEKNSYPELYKYYKSRKIRNILEFLIGFGVGFITSLFVITKCAGF